ncbi:MAG: serine hydrolase domain-containing protein [Bacteroidales bacterium]
MMKKWLFSLGLLLIATAGYSCCKEDSDREDGKSRAQIEAELSAKVQQMLSQYKVEYPDYPGGVALKVICKKGAFFVSKGLGEGVTDQIRFRAASNTKLLTSTAILLLAQEGKLQINHRILDTIPGQTRTYIADEPAYQIPYAGQITIDQLLHHTAGVFDVTNFDIPDTVSADVPYKGLNYLSYVMDQEPAHTFSFDELVGVNATCGLYNFAPGTAYKYSNTGYSLLGKIIERVSGMNYSRYISEKILQPMQLQRSSMPFRGTDQTLPSPFARGYFYTPEVVDCTETNISCNVAEGNLVTTPDDLALFLRALLRGEGVLTAHTVNSSLLKIPQIPSGSNSYACGIFYAQNLGWGHNGAHAGYLSRMVSDPESDITIVAFTNCWNVTNGIKSIEDQLNNLLDELCYKAKYIVQ